MTVTRDSIWDCPCEGGCPSCVQSPRCGSENRPLDKWGAAFVLTLLLGLKTDQILIKSSRVRRKSTDLLSKGLRC